VERIIEKVSQATETSPERVSAIVDNLFLQLHRQFYEYKGLNGDYIGEELHWQLSRMSYFHLMGSFRLLIERYTFDEPEEISEYLLRLALAKEWEIYSSQMNEWVPPEK
jgi:hypothetical protein